MAARKATESAIIAQVLVERDAEDLGGLEVPALADDRDRRRPCFDQGLHPGVVLGGDSLAAGHPEGGDAGVLELEVADRAEVGGVFGVGEGIAAFDVVDPQLVEPRGDQQLVLEREVDPLALAAVAQSRVVDRDPRHGAAHPCRQSCERAANDRDSSP